MTLKRGAFGYSFRDEQEDKLQAFGEEPRQLLKRFKDNFPKLDITDDPLGVIEIKDQGSVGSCVGQSIAQTFSICYWLATGRKAIFSAACGYYHSQKVDRINGDNGATISGAMEVATKLGMCLESDWPYEPRYNPRQPSGIEFRFKLSVSKPIRDVDTLMEMNAEGLPIHWGRSWTSSDDREVVDSWRDSRNSGGHATVLWQRLFGNVNDINSWGRRWSGDGQHQYTYNALKSILADRWTVAVCYAPDAMSFPPLEPIS